MSTANSTTQFKRAVVLLSGGLDSSTVLGLARARGFDCYALSVHYGQRHSAELAAARQIALRLGAREHRVMGVDLAGIGGSALTDAGIAIPEFPTNATFVVASTHWHCARLLAPPPMPI